jgi:hypothetical protein
MDCFALNWLAGWCEAFGLADLGKVSRRAISPIDDPAPRRALMEFHHWESRS